MGREVFNGFVNETYLRRGRKMARKKKESDEERILSDIKQFYQNIKEVEETPEREYAISQARSYCEDAKYFLEKGDAFTAWGCINYAHGLLDAFRKKK